MADQLDRLKAALADRYRIERELGSGGMASVYLAQDLKHERQVAVKVLRPELAAALGSDRFLREIKIAANLNHPHILPLHDSGEADGFLFYVMPYVEGESLRDRLNREKQLPIPDALKIAGEVADALSFAHDHNVIHRDIKPENILLEARHAVVADFGVARAIEQAGETRLTETGIAIGTPAYLSPEQASGERELDGRSDVYAVGCVLYEMLAGQPPFTGPTAESIAHQHLSVEPPSVTAVRPTVPADVANTLGKALAKAPADRFDTAAQLVDALNAALLTISAPTVTLKRKVPAAVLAFVGSVVVLAAVALVLLRPGVAGAALDPNHLVVAVFRNAAGDPSFDLLGERIGQWITQGVQQAAIPVTPWTQALQSWEYAQTEMDAGRVRDPVRTLAEETGAGTVISGAVYLVEGDSLEIHVEATNALRGGLLGVVDPVRGPRASENEIIANVQRRVMTFLAVRFEERMRDWAPGQIAEPPAFEAYLAFNEGLRHTFRGEYEEAITYYRRAFELDSTWAAPLFRMRWALYNLGSARRSDSMLAEADSVVRLLEGLGKLLTPYEQTVAQFMRAHTDGERDQALAMLRRVSELAPRSPDHYGVVVQANDQNRPREALEVLSSFDPERGWVREFADYWTEVAEALHKLGEHERELEATQRAYRLHPNSGAYLLPYQARALVALGRVADVVDLFDEIATAPDAGAHPQSLVEPADCLRVNGHLAAAREFASRAVNWFETRPPDQAESREHRLQYARALFLAGQLEQARDALDLLVSGYPETVEFRGVRGVVAAAGADTAQAMADAEWLAGLDRPYLYGEQLFWCGAIVGSFGNQDAAVGLLTRAFAEGQRLYTRTFARFELDAVRDHPDFQDLMRPKG